MALLAHFSEEAPAKVSSDTRTRWSIALTKSLNREVKQPAVREGGTGIAQIDFEPMEEQKRAVCRWSMAISKTSAEVAQTRFGERNIVKVRSIYHHARNYRTTSEEEETGTASAIMGMAALRAVRSGARSSIRAAAVIQALESNLAERRALKKEARTQEEEVKLEQQVQELEQDLSLGKSFAEIQQRLKAAVAALDTKAEMHTKLRLQNLIHSVLTNTRILGNNFVEMAMRMKEAKSLLDAVSETISNTTSKAQPGLADLTEWARLYMHRNPKLEEPASADSESSESDSSEEDEDGEDQGLASVMLSQKKRGPLRKVARSMHRMCQVALKDRHTSAAPEGDGLSLNGNARGSDGASSAKIAARLKEVILHSGLQEIRGTLSKIVAVGEKHAAYDPRKAKKKVTINDGIELSLPVQPQVTLNEEALNSVSLGESMLDTADPSLEMTEESQEPAEPEVPSLLGSVSRKVIARNLRASRTWEKVRGKKPLFPRPPNYDQEGVPFLGFIRQQGVELVILDRKRRSEMIRSVESPRKAALDDSEEAETMEEPELEPSVEVPIHLDRLRSTWSAGFRASDAADTDAGVEAGPGLQRDVALPILVPTATRSGHMLVQEALSLRSKSKPRGLPAVSWQASAASANASCTPRTPRTSRSKHPPQTLRFE